MVGDNHNLMVVGRSGTGKTSCALMRLFAMEIYFKNQKARCIHEKISEEPFRLRILNLETNSGLKSVFLAESVILIT